jgi:hypothetical protein
VLADSAGWAAVAAGLSASDELGVEGRLTQPPSAAVDVAAGVVGAGPRRGWRAGGPRSFVLLLFGGVSADAGSLALPVAFALDDEFERCGLQPVDRGLGQ